MPHSTYQAAYAAWQHDPEAYWASLAGAIDWDRPWDRVFDHEEGPYGRWFTGAMLNTCHNCLDRHVAAGAGDRIALIWDSAMLGEVRHFTYAALRDELKRLLEDPNAQIPGLTLQPRDRWDILTHLAQQGEPHTADLFSSESAAHHTGEDQKYAYAAQAAIPHPATKAQYFADYQSTSIQEDWLTQSLRPFSSYNQQTLTLPYLRQSLDLLPQIKANRKIFFLGAWLSAFLDGQSTPEAQTIVNQWLQGKEIDPDLRLKVLENKDALDRTVLIRRTYPI